MTNMISVATGFQSSVNIAYDMNDDGKLKNYIPTKSALSLLEDVLLSTSQNSTDRARILIGAYGKGKSHIVLMILSILMKKDPELFEKMMPVISSEKPELYQLIQNYYHGSNKILPVVISGSSNSLAQAFLLALERTLAENELTDIMPETNYQAAINTIVKWKSNFPETYNCFKTLIDGQANKFIERLHDFDPSAYAEFEKLYPSLTAGSHFNPFVGFDVAELYEEVVKALKPKGYTGIYVIYDEFSKYLENHISDATKSDTKMLVTKYRHPVLTRDVKDTVYERIHYIAEQRGFRILEINGEPDHIHILMEVDAITSLAELANVLKTQTARRARKLYGETLLKKYYWKPYFWSDSYFITTVSENSLKVVKQYIQNQGKR